MNFCLSLRFSLLYWQMAFSHRVLFLFLPQPNCAYLNGSFFGLFCSPFSCFRQESIVGRFIVCLNLLYHQDFFNSFEISLWRSQIPKKSAPKSIKFGIQHRFWFGCNFFCPSRGPWHSGAFSFSPRKNLRQNYIWFLSNFSRFLQKSAACWNSHCQITHLAESEWVWIWLTSLS